MSCQKTRIVVITFVGMFVAMSIYFLMPTKNISNNVGSIASELLVQEFSNGKSIQINYVDLDGNITYAIDKHYASVVKLMDLSGRVVKEQFYDAEGYPAKQVSGYYGISYKYGLSDFIQETTYLDEYGNACIIDNGYAIVKHTYDFNNNVVCDIYYDLQLNPVQCVGGYYGVRKEYKNGVYFAVNYLGKDMELINNSQGYARKTYKYDKNNMTNIEMYYDSKGRATSLQEGQFGMRYITNEENRIIQITYLNEQGDPMITKSGYTSLKRTYYRDGAIDTEMYFDINEKPKALSKGQYGIKKSGNINFLLDKNGHNMLCIDNILNGLPYMVVVFGCIICLVIWILPKPVSIFITIVYTIFILYETLMFREVGKARANLIIFSYADQFLTEQSVRVGVINNIWLFVPLGAGIYKVFKKKWVLLLLFLFSASIEVIQYMTGFGIAELDDIFGNTLGGLIGAASIYFMETGRLEKK